MRELAPTLEESFDNAQVLKQTCRKAVVNFRVTTTLSKKFHSLKIGSSGNRDEVYK